MSNMTVFSELNQALVSFWLHIGPTDGLCSDYLYSSCLPLPMCDPLSVQRTTDLIA